MNYKVDLFSVLKNIRLSVRPSGLFRVLYLDPPWQFRNWSTNSLKKYDINWARRNGRSPYPVMKTEDLYSIPVWRLAHQDSAMLMWTTSPKMVDGISLLNTYGFEFKTIAFTWVKLNPSGRGWHFGLGYHSHQNAEYCLLGTRGKGVKRVDKSVFSLVIHPRGKHSAKPPQVRDRIIKLYGDVPRCELFAREECPGFGPAWGNEVRLDYRFEAINSWLAPPAEFIFDEDEAEGLPVVDTVQPVDSYSDGEQMRMM